MRFWRSSKLAAVLAIAILAGAGWLMFKPSPKTATPPAPAASQTGQATTTTNKADPAKSAAIETVDFIYQKPVDWLQIKGSALDQAGATSGIGRASSPVATFKTSDSSSTPKDDNDLKNSTLNDIKKNAPNFELLSSVSTKVDNHAGQKFTYSFTDKDGKNKVRQQLSAVPYKGKTFFFLAASVDTDFDKLTGDFASILASVQFK